MYYDVVVVGAGPSGCVSAKYASKNGASTLILEEDREIGFPVRCAGLISDRAFRESELSARRFENCVEQTVRGALFHSPNVSFRVDAGGEKAFVIRRCLFDRLLADDAVAAGSDIMVGCRLVGIKNDKRGELTLKVMRDGVEKKIRTKIVIGADGISGITSSVVGYKIKRYRRILSCAQLEGKYENEEDFVELFFGNNVAPGFFAWSIPVYRKISRIGLCIDPDRGRNENAFRFLKKCLYRHPIMSRRYRGSVTAFYAGAIPIGLLPKTAEEKMRIILVGDAAAQVKPTTGGGIYYGMKCGKIAGKVSAEAVSAEKPSEMSEILREYERRWRSAIEKEIRLGMRIHKLRCRMNDNDLDDIFNEMKKGEIIRLIEKYGDIDYPSVVIHRLMRYAVGDRQLLSKGVKLMIKYMLWPSEW